eukprot:COSAG06_NODE_4422_length_4284_cov_2.134289_2_plen_54_part_00
MAAVGQAGTCALFRSTPATGIRQIQAGSLQEMVKDGARNRADSTRQRTHSAKK